MVHVDAIPVLSAAAQKVGFREGHYLCFEEDCDAAVVFRELLDKPGWQIPSGYLNTKDRFEAAIDRSLEAWHKEYLQTRQAPAAAEKPARPKHRSSPER